MSQSSQQSVKYWIGIFLVMLIMLVYILPSASCSGVAIAAKGIVSISILAPPGTVYDWIGGVPAMTDNTNYDWVGGKIFVRLEVLGKPDIIANPTNWTLNGITGNGKISTNTIYYANPLGDTTAPSPTVLDTECYFTITNSSTMNINITVDCSNFSGGSANMSNSNTGSNGATSYGGYSWYSGMTYANKVIMKTSGSSILWTSTNPGDDIKIGAEIKTQTNEWTGGSSSTATMTITASAS